MPRLEENNIQIENREIICIDGFKMSVQASRTHYCTPRVDGFDVFYSQVEVGFPNKVETLLLPYADGQDSEIYTCEVFAYVPAAIIYNILQKHGGMIGGGLPNLYLNDSYVDRFLIEDEVDESYDDLTYGYGIVEDLMEEDEIAVYEDEHKDRS